MNSTPKQPVWTQPFAALHPISVPFPVPVSDAGSARSTPPGTGAMVLYVQQ